MPSSSRQPIGSAGSFQAFFEDWLVRQQRFLDELLSAQESSSTTTTTSRFDDTDVVGDLIARVLAHYQEYYDEKSRMAHRNVFLAFSPTWFTPLERTFLWIAGFKPGLVCRLALSSLDDLTEDQIHRINGLSRETNWQEKSLDQKMAKIQESVASPPLVDLARREGMQIQSATGSDIEGGIDDVDNQIEPLKSAMQNILRDADGLRTRTAETMAGILSPLQNVRFLSAAARLQFRIRMLGFQREADRQRGSTTNGW
ncbi:protein ZW2-like [Coffea arabica]|uniref:Protein ZW2-like n=1 Tax=Coffea arabica TaxID=13443 RepID=A0A6P6SXJ9_COFAR|nr:protein DOG1-like 4 [Coffea arabica]